MTEAKRTIVYSLKHVACDGGAFGKLWSETLFYDKERAEDHMTVLVSHKNDREIARDRPHALYKKGTLYDKSGWYSMQYGLMFYIDELEIY